MILKMKSGECETSSTEQTTSKGLHLLSWLFKHKPAETKKALKPTTKSSDANPRRKFVRVIRDNEHVGEEYQNPHVVRRYTKGFWEENNIRKASSLEDTSRPLPYTVSGHTILKKHSFPEADCLGHKRATFKNEVQVIVFSRIEKTASCKRMTRSMPLVTFDESCAVLSKPPVDKEDSGEVEEDASLENSVDDGAKDDVVENDCEQKDAEESQTDSTACSDSEQLTDECVVAGQFAALVAADEKDMYTNRLKRKLSSSSGSSDSSQLAREA